MIPSNPSNPVIPSSVSTASFLPAQASKVSRGELSRGERWSKEETEKLSNYIKWLERNVDKFSSAHQGLMYIKQYFPDRSLNSLISKCRFLNGNRLLQNISNSKSLIKISAQASLLLPGSLQSVALPPRDSSLSSQIDVTVRTDLSSIQSPPKRIESVSLIPSQDLGLPTISYPLPAKDGRWTKEESEIFLQHLKWLENNKDKFSSVQHGLASINIFFPDRSLEGLLTKRSDLICRSSDHSHPGEEFIHGVSQGGTSPQASSSKKRKTTSSECNVNEPTQKSSKRLASDLDKSSIYLTSHLLSDLHSLPSTNDLTDFNWNLPDSSVLPPITPTKKKEMTSEEINIFKGVFLTQIYGSSDQRMSLKEVYAYLVANFFKDSNIAEMERIYLDLVQKGQLPELLSPIESPKTKEMTSKEINIFKGVLLTQIYTRSDQRKSLEEVYAYLVADFFKDSDVAEMERIYLHLVQNGQLPEYPKA